MERPMKWTCTLFLMVSFFSACASKTEERRETAVFTVFHSNDITGYLTPCG